MAFAKHSNGRLFRILTGSPVCADIYLELRVMAAGGTHKDKGEDVSVPTATTKSAAPRTRDAAAVFPQQKTTESVLADSRVINA